MSITGDEVTGDVVHDSTGGGMYPLTQRLSSGDGEANFLGGLPDGRLLGGFAVFNGAGRKLPCKAALAHATPR